MHQYDSSMKKLQREVFVAHENQLKAEEQFSDMKETLRVKDEYLK